MHICAHVCGDVPVCVRPCRVKRLVLAVSIYCSTAYWFPKNSLSELGTHPSGQDVWSPRNMLDSVPPALRFQIHAPGALNQAHRLSQQLICYLRHLLPGPCCRLWSYCKSLTLRFSAKPKGPYYRQKCLYGEALIFLYYLLLMKWGKDIKNTLYQMLKEMKIFDIKTPTYSKRYHISTLGSIQKCKGMTLTSGYREPVPQDMCVRVNLHGKYIGKRYSSPQDPQKQTHCFSNFPRNFAKMHKKLIGYKRQNSKPNQHQNKWEQCNKYSIY